LQTFNEEYDFGDELGGEEYVAEEDDGQREEYVAEVDDGHREEEDQGDGQEQEQDEEYRPSTSKSAKKSRKKAPVREEVSNDMHDLLFARTYLTVLDSDI